MSLGRGWGGLQEADRREEGQASGLPADPDWPVHREPDPAGQGAPGPDEEDQEEEEEEDRKTKSTLELYSYG